MTTNNSVNTPLAGSTGTGNFVGANTPTLITPVIGAATGTSLAFSPTTGGIIGTTTNDNTTAGKVGEFVTSTVTFASPVTITSSTVAQDVTTISLTAGDWDLFGNLLVNNNAVGFSNVSTWISTSSAALPNAELRNQIFIGAASAMSTYGTNVPNIRLSLSGTTTVYLSQATTYSTGTTIACGTLSARRRR